MLTNSLNKAWVLTFTDLVSLLLTFFVMLFAMSTPPNLKTSPEILLVQGLSSSNTSLVQTFPKRSVNLDYLYHVLLEKPLQIKDASLQLEKDTLILSLPITVSSDPSEFISDSDQTENIQSLGYILNNLSNKIAIRTTSDLNNIEQALGFSAQIANLLKQGGYVDAIPVYAFLGLEEKPYIDILIYPYTKETSL